MAVGRPRRGGCPGARRLTPAPNHQVLMNQYVVDDAGQTSGFGAYSLTYIGPDLSGSTLPAVSRPVAGGRTTSTPVRSSGPMPPPGRAGNPGRTTIEVRGVG
ncbi:hypothetical protein NKG94_12530 [Micromonospora sp. M12]